MTFSKEALQAYQSRAKEAFLRRGFPSPGAVSFRHLKVFALDKIDILALPPSQEKLKLKSRPSGVEVFSLKEALLTYHTHIHGRLNALIEDEDPFLLLNGALHDEGIFIYIPPKMVLKEPLEIEFPKIGANERAAFRIHLLMGREAEAEIIYRFQTVSEEALQSSVTDLFLNEGARLLLRTDAASEKKGWRFDHVRATLKKNSSFRSLMATSGSFFDRTDYHIRLIGESAECDLSGLFMLDRKNEAHINVLMELEAPFCRTMQLFKGALLEESQSSFEGKILVQKNAQKTESYQLNNNLIFSPKAKAFSEPNLEIMADDVKASHGATFGRLSEEAFFYLMSRGFNRKEAAALLTKSFFEEVLEKGSAGAYLEEIHQKIDQFVESLS